MNAFSPSLVDAPVCRRPDSAAATSLCVKLIDFSEGQKTSCEVLRPRTLVAVTSFGGYNVELKLRVVLIVFTTLPINATYAPIHR